MGSGGDEACREGELAVGEHAQDGLGVKLAAEWASEFPSPLAARIRALCAFEEHAQDGLGFKRPAEWVSEFPSSLAARIRALCASADWN